ncbi:MAG: glycosyltransferase family 2 protein [Chloroflexi bacterium]|nr:glycosyltransferase family 2 protein [Chloroflexota bacterium]
MIDVNGSNGRGDRPRLVVIIPAYNEEPTVGRAVAEVPRELPGVGGVEVLVVDDGSRDRTAEAAMAAGADAVIRLRQNAGLTRAFATGLQAAVERGADIVVNTDADCQYDGREIADLIAPILAGEADLVSGDRQVTKLDHMARSKQYGNRFGSWMLRFAAGSTLQDASSGFRAFTRECALRLNPTIGNTYTHQTIVQAVHAGMVVREVPVSFRQSAREGGHSRLISSVAGHIVRSAVTIMRTLVAYRPLAVLGTTGLILLALAALVGLIPLSDVITTGDTSGHLQALITTVALSIAGLVLLLFGFLADAVSANRRVTEELLYRVRKEQAGRIEAAGAEGETSVSGRISDREAPVLIGSGSRSGPFG